LHGFDVTGVLLEVYSRDALETLADVLLDSLKVVRLGKDLDQLVVRQEVKARELVSLVLKVLLKLLLNVCQSFLVPKPSLMIAETFANKLPPEGHAHVVLETLVDLLEFCTFLPEL
jgi:hypothetical protein